MLKGQGADVVELANGCICCSLRSDLARQLSDMVAKYAPQRVIIEPSGVADVASLLAVLNRPGIVENIRDLRVYTLIDAGAFLKDYARMQRYFQVQASVSRLFVVNKADLVSPAELKLVEASLAELNPAAHVVRARFGEVLGQDLDVKLARMPVGGARAVAAPAQTQPIVLAPAEAMAASVVQPAAPHVNGHGHNHDHGHAHTHASQGHDHGHIHDHEHHDDFELGLESWSAHVDKPCEVEALDRFLQVVTNGGFGNVERLKGIVHAGSGWLRFDVAGARSSIRSSILAFSPVGVELPRIMAIGKSVDCQGLMGGLAACSAK